MQLRHGIAAVFLASVMGACGLYTNIPAQIKVASTQTPSATVTYKVDQSKISADVVNPTIALEGEPGSIGVTYDEITIEYLPANLSINPRQVVIAGSIRVPSSHQFGENNQVVVGRVETQIPVVSSHVVQLGNPLSQNRVNSQISAKVTLKGTDDAGFESIKELYIPINFLSSELPTTTP